MRNILLPFGRMRRIYYWLFGFLISFFVGLAEQPLEHTEEPFLSVLILGPFIWVGAMIGIQRAHDIGSKICARLWSASLVILTFGITVAANSEPGTQPIVGVATLASLVTVVVINLIFLFKGGTVGPNEFGPDPRGRSAAKVI